MITINKTIDATDLISKEHIPSNDWLFFDIETTGFSSKINTLYLIGCIYIKDNICYLTQWLAEKKSDENSILAAFYNFSKSFSTILHYNGNGFDIPFIKDKARHYQIPLDFEAFKNIDIYKNIKPYKKALKLENLKQKTVEHFLEINRNDTKNGGELISVFNEYEKNGDKELEAMLLLHNEEDILGMLKILPMFAYRSLFEGNISNPEFELNNYSDIRHENKQEGIFSFEINHSLPKRISCGLGPIYMSAYKNSGKIKVEINRCELKYFFPNYQDYYYLPLEDTSIHKSVAFYVDKNFRTKAKAANCYSRKTGIFLPQQEEIVTPFFKEDYHDKKTFFEITDEFCADKDLQLKYILHLLKLLSEQ